MGVVGGGVYRWSWGLKLGTFVIYPKEPQISSDIIEEFEQLLKI